MKADQYTKLYKISMTTYYCKTYRILHCIGPVSFNTSSP